MYLIAETFLLTADTRPVQAREQVACVHFMLSRRKILSLRGYRPQKGNQQVYVSCTKRELAFFIFTR